MNKNLIFDIFKKLKLKGCSGSDIFVVKNSYLSSSRRLRKLEKNESSENLQIGIRAIKGKKQSIISSSNLSNENINELIEKVVEMTSVIPENNYCGLADENQIEKFKEEEFNKLDLYDPYKPSLSELFEKTSILEDSALSNEKITNSEGAEISWSKSDYILAASNGMYQKYSKTSSSFIIAVLAGDKLGMEREYEFNNKVYFQDLGNLKKIGELTASKAVARLNPRKIKTCKASVIYDSRTSASLLRHLASASIASTVARGTSFLKDKLQKKLFNKNINIIDNPLLPRMTKTKIFDCEGIRSEKKNLVENGYLKFFFNSLETARQLNQSPSGHASRSVSSLPFPSTSNLFLENGSVTKESLIKSLNKGLLVTELMGSSINMSNGDYSRGASGFWIENGEITFPVSEITIAGNLFEIFSNLIPANDLEFRFGINSPSCLVENMTIAGI